MSIRKCQDILAILPAHHPVFVAKKLDDQWNRCGSSYAFRLLVLQGSEVTDPVNPQICHKVGALQNIFEVENPVRESARQPGDYVGRRTQTFQAKASVHG